MMSGRTQEQENRLRAAFDMAHFPSSSFERFTKVVDAIEYHDVKVGLEAMGAFLHPYLVIRTHDEVKWQALPIYLQVLGDDELRFHLARLVGTMILGFAQHEVLKHLTLDGRQFFRSEYEDGEPLHDQWLPA